MTQETLERAKRLEALIRSSQRSVDELGKYFIPESGIVSIGNINITADKELLTQVVALVRDYKKKRIGEHLDELDRL